MLRTITNGRGQSIQTVLSDQEAVERFLELHGDTDHWLWYHIHKLVREDPHGRAKSLLLDWFYLAHLHGIKKPMVRVVYLVERFCIDTTPRGTLRLRAGEIVPGSDADPVGAREYVGCFASGGFWPADNRVMKPAEQVFLRQLADRPGPFLHQCSRDMRRCCFCWAPLDDARSIVKGYGPVCARHWGLPWGDYGDDRRVASFAEAWDDTCHGLLNAIRDEEPNAKLIFNDWLESKGLLPIEV